MARLLWLQGDSGKNSGAFLIDADTRKIPIIFDGADQDFNFGFFFYDAPLDISSIESITCSIVESQTNPTVVASKTVDSEDFESELITLSNWNNKFDFNVQVSFIGEELDYALGALTEVTLWMVLTANLEGGGEQYLAAGPIRLAADASEIPGGLVYMLKSVYDTDGDGIVEQADFAAVAAVATTAQAVDWDDVQDKPATFPAADPEWDDVQNKPATFPADDPEWDDVQNKPATFPPEAHAHSTFTSGAGASAGFAPAGENPVDGTKALFMDGTWKVPIAGGGEVNTASNVGGGDAEVFQAKDGVDFQFRTLSGLGQVTVSENGSVVEISVPTPQDTVWRNTVKGYVDCTAVPPTEVTGDRYILDDSGSVHANWDGASAFDIVQFNGTTWDAFTPSEGWRCYSDADNADRRFIDDGTPQWEVVPTGSGEANTASNVGTGVSVFKQKTGIDLEFRKFLGTVGEIDVTLSTDDILFGLPDNPVVPGDLVFNEQADHASTPGAGKGYVWVKNTTPSTLIFTDDAGADHVLGVVASQPRNLRYEGVNASASPVGASDTFTCVRWTVNDSGVVEFVVCDPSSDTLPCNGLIYGQVAGDAQTDVYGIGLHVEAAFNTSGLSEATAYYVGAAGALTDRTTAISNGGYLQLIAVVPYANSGSGAIHVIEGGFERANADQWAGNLEITGQAWTGIQALTSGTTVATDCNLSNCFSLSLAHNATLSNPTNLKAGATYVWIVTQTAGSNTLAFGSVFKWPGGTAPTIASGAGQVSIITGVSNGTNVYAAAQTNLS